MRNDQQKMSLNILKYHFRAKPCMSCFFPLFPRSLYSLFQQLRINMHNKKLIFNVYVYDIYISKDDNKYAVQCSA